LKKDRNIGIIIQARTNSTRLPGKVLLDVGGEPLIIYIYNRIQSHFHLPIIVATTNSNEDDDLVKMLIDKRISVFRGSENNVIRRFIDAAINKGFSDIIRICADNAFLDFDFLDQLIELWKGDTENDYISFEFKNKPVILSHFGVFAEIVKLSALEKVASLFPDNDIYKEHITNGVYMNPRIFKIRLINLDKELTPFEGIRLTIDTKEDFERITELMAELKSTKFKEIANFILSNPGMLKGMKETILENSK
jgi:spore coat polysaccharide biosynthesis protein SpsF